jgi:hypothetical protein
MYDKKRYARLGDGERLIFAQSTGMNDRVYESKIPLHDSCLSRGVYDGKQS